MITLLYIQEKDKTIVVRTEQIEAVDYIKKTKRKNAGIFGTPSFNDLNMVYGEFAPFEYYNSMDEFLEMEKTKKTELNKEEEISFIPYEYTHYSMAQLVDIIQHLKVANKYKDDEIVRLNEKLRAKENRKKIKIIKIDSEDN